MTAPQPSDIMGQVRQVLLNAHKSNGTQPNYLTALQILDRLPADIKTRLIGDETGGKVGAGTVNAALEIVSEAARMLGDTEVTFMDCAGATITAEGQPDTPIHEVCGLYRI